MTSKIETDYDTGWREGYEAASGAVLAKVERLRVMLSESERVSAERQKRLIELRDALIKIEAASRKLGMAPGYLGDMAGRALAGPNNR